MQSIRINEERGVRYLQFGVHWIQGAMRINRPWSLELEYTRDVDRKLLVGDAVNVEFTLDKFLPAGAIEQRELGVIATSVGFEAK